MKIFKENCERRTSTKKGTCIGQVTTRVFSVKVNNIIKTRDRK